MFPSGEEYVNAIRNINTCVIDKSFHGGQPRNKGFLIEQYSGGYSRVFPIQVRNRTFALRCFVSDVKDVKYRYQIISEYLKKLNINFFVEFSYVESGIRVKGKQYPIIRMEWFDGDTLKNFLQKNRHNSKLIRKTADAFLNMVQTLHIHGISHGDLQDENILVKYNGSQIEIKLIDYDSLYVSDLKGSKQQIVGKPNFQHPVRIQQKNSLYANESMDYFSELVIYISLLALAEKPSLWDQYQLDEAEGLIFEDTDFQNPSSSGVFKNLCRLSSEINALSSILNTFCLKHNLEELLPLEAVIQHIKTTSLLQVPAKKQSKISMIKIILCISIVTTAIIFGINYYPEFKQVDKLIISEKKHTELSLNKNEYQEAVKQKIILPIKPESDRAFQENLFSHILDETQNNKDLNNINQNIVQDDNNLKQKDETDKKELLDNQSQDNAIHQQVSKKKPIKKSKTVRIKSDTVIQSIDKYLPIIQIEQALLVSAITTPDDNGWFQVEFDVWIIDTPYQRIKMPCYLFAEQNMKYFIGHVNLKYVENLVDTTIKDGVLWNKYRIKGGCFY